MRQIEQGDLNYEMPESHREGAGRLLEDALGGGHEAEDEEMAQIAQAGRRSGTPRSRRLLEASNANRQGDGYQPPGGAPRLPKPPSRAGSNDGGYGSKGKPRKNWKNDLGNWIYILGTTQSSMKAKNVAQKNSIENYAPVRGGRANT